MPTSFFSMENQLPRVGDNLSLEAKVDQIHSYLYQLVEQLRYTMGNLGRENLNDTEYINITNEISEPLEKDISVIVKSLAGADGTLTDLTLVPGALLIRMSDAEGAVSELSQTVNGLTLSVSNGSYSSTIKLMSGSIQLASSVISFSGMVTFSDLSGEGRTTINGSNITTGTISAINIEGCTISGSLFKSTLESDGSPSGALSFYYINENNLAGGILLDDTGAGTTFEAQYRMFLYTRSVGGVAFGLKLLAAGGMSLESYKSIYMYAPSYITLECDGSISIHNPILIDADGGRWTFNSEGIFRDGSLVLSLGGTSEPEPTT